METDRTVQNTRIYRVEQKVYQLLGVELFRKMVFGLERLIHWKDGGKNVNYHIARNRLSDTEKFVKFLFYNGSIHVRNLVYAGVYGLMRILFGDQFHLIDVLVLINAVKDIYCVMLQRYNYLRIREVVARQSQRRKAKIEKHAANLQERFDARYQGVSRERDLELIREIQAKIRSSGVVVVDEETEDLLRRMSALTKDSGKREDEEKDV